MNLTTKGRYAVMAMVDLSLQDQTKPVPLADIAKRQNIALNYLEQIFMKLRRSGIVRSVRGPGGGYLLSQPAKEITIAQVIFAADEQISMTKCKSDKNKTCINKERCRTHDLWEGLSNHIYNYLNSITVADVCRKKINVRDQIYA